MQYSFNPNYILIYELAIFLDHQQRSPFEFRDLRRVSLPVS